MTPSISDIVKAYANFGRFCCSATLKRTIKTDISRESLFSMKLDFLRSQNFFLELTTDRDHRKTRRIVIADAKCILEYTDDIPIPEWASYTSLEELIVRFAGISAGLCLHIPSLLLNFSEHKLFERVDSSECLSDSGIEQIRISGVGRQKIKRVIQLQKSNLAIVSMYEKFAIAEGSVECTTRYCDVVMSS